MAAKTIAERRRRSFFYSAAAAAVLGLIALVAYAWRRDAVAGTFAVGLMTACAAAGAGGFLGFLFGIPRALAGNAGDENERGHRGNTNLEQISDWLTKILVGAGLTQLGTLRDGGADLVRSLAPSFGKGASAAPFAAGLLVYFLVVGFVGGWLVTRLFLGPMLTEADEEALEMVQAAADAKARGDEAGASRLLQDAAQRLLVPAADAAARYMQSRAETPPGPGRMRRMGRVVREARRAAADPAMDAKVVRAIYDRGVGERVYALGLMQEKPSLADADRIANSIARSESAFEQYNALRAARLALPHLSAAGRDSIRAAVVAQRGEGGWIKEDTDRWAPSEELLRLLGEPPEE